MGNVRYNNKFFHTREEAKAFQREHGGCLYSCIPRSSTKHAFRIEMAVAFDARQEIVDMNKTPWCVAWNEIDGE